MLDVALAHARRGFLVFPIKQGAKAPPLVANWQHLATTDEAQIRSWWTQWPEANVGIHCAGLLVIDVDPKKGGYDSLEKLEEEVFLEATYEVETPSAGRHIYYRTEAQVKNGVDVLGEGIDVRAANGYVVGAGSRTEAGIYVVCADEPLAAVPAELARRCAASSAARAEPLGARVVGEGEFHTDADAAVARAQDFLRNHPVAVEGQGGDFHTYRTVCRVRDFGVPQERAAEALSEWNARCEPPWPADGLELKIRNAYAYAQEPAGKLTPEALGFEVLPESSPQISESGVKQTVNLLHPADVTLDEVLANEYLIKGVLERQSNAVLFGHWNVGKTFVVLDMAASIACGKQWFGKRVRQGRVLYLGYEGIRAMKKRMYALREKYPMLKDRKTPFEWHALRQPLTQSAGVQEIGTIMSAFGTKHDGPPDLVVIDPLANALGGDDADAGLMGALNTCVAEIMRKQRCTVLRVHHSGHGNQERARGHSSLPAGVDTEIRVNEQEIALTKQRDDVRAKFSFRLNVVDVGVDADGDAISTCVVEQIEDNPLSPELTRPQREFLDRLLSMRGDGGAVSKTDVRDASSSASPDERREMLRILERKQYLRVEGAGWVLCERGPLQIFD